MKKILALILTLAMSAMCLIACGGAKDNDNDNGADSANDNAEKTYTVGICQLVAHPALDAATQGFMDALTAELGDKVTFLNEDANNEPAVCTTIVTNFVNKKVDLIMANATPALTAAVNGTSTIPVLGTSITEYGVALGIDDFSGTVGGNVSGTSDLAPLDEQAAMILDLFPEAQTVAMLYCSSEPNSAYQVKVVKAALEAQGITVLDKSFTDSNDVNVVAANAAAEADVIYIPTDNSAAECATAINGVIGDTPVIAGESGICSGCGVATLSIEYYDLGYATGKMAAQILTGEADISTMPVQYAAEFTKMYNAEKCAQLNIDTAALEAKGYVAISAE